MMTFKESLNTVYREKYATFQGRAQRSEYWWFQLFLAINVLVFGGIGYYFWSRADPLLMSADTIPGITWFLFTIGGIIALASIVPNICLGVRRFHDVGLSGWWYLGLALLSALPLVGWAAEIASLVIAILKGTVGSNKFGLDPLSPIEEQAAAIFE